jgi:hypothetical protein
MWVLAFFQDRIGRDRAAAQLPSGLVDQVYREDPAATDGAERPVWESMVVGAVGADMPLAGPVAPSEPVTGTGAAQARADAPFQLAVSTHRPDAVAGWLAQHSARWVEMSDAPPR